MGWMTTRKQEPFSQLFTLLGTLPLPNKVETLQIVLNTLPKRVPKFLLNNMGTLFQKDKVGGCSLCPDPVGQVTAASEWQRDFSRLPQITMHTKRGSPLDFRKEGPGIKLKFHPQS